MYTNMTWYVNNALATSSTVFLALKWLCQILAPQLNLSMEVILWVTWSFATSPDWAWYNSIVTTLLNALKFCIQFTTQTKWCATLWTVEFAKCCYTFFPFFDWVSMYNGKCPWAWLCWGDWYYRSNIIIRLDGLGLASSLRLFGSSSPFLLLFRYMSVL